MVTHKPTPDRHQEALELSDRQEPGASLIVMHAHERRATHVLVMDPDLFELDRTGGVFGAQGFKVTLSSALLDLDSLAYFAADLLVVRPPAGESSRWEAYIRAAAADSRLRDMPVVWLTGPEQQAPDAATRLAHILTCPWTPFDLLTLVDSLVAACNSSGSNLPELSTPGQPFGHSFAAGSD